MNTPDLQMRIMLYYRKMGLTLLDALIIELIDHRSGATRSQLLTTLDVAPRTLDKAIDRCVSKGWVKRTTIKQERSGKGRPEATLVELDTAGKQLVEDSCEYREPQ